MPDLSSSEMIPHKRAKSISPKITSNKYSHRGFFHKCLQIFAILSLQIFILSYIFGNPSKLVSVRQETQEEIITSAPLVITTHQETLKEIITSAPLVKEKEITSAPLVTADQVTRKEITSTPPPPPEECKNGKVYVYDLPKIFNRDFLINCGELDPWHSRCRALSNYGLGPKSTGLDHIMPGNLSSSWYWTDMFAGEVVYHARMMSHRCRTLEVGSATAFYIPFYAGLAVAKYLFTNYTAKDRDRHCELVLDWVRGQDSWRRSNGSDHFIMLGRMTWDFRRSDDKDWGSSFLHMPLMKEVLRLSVERSPWDPLEVGVPYPTGFHPKSKSELGQWVDFVKSRTRRSLFTFVGAKRKIKSDFRTILLDHCYKESKFCRVVDCSGQRCYDGTSEILESFLDSDFCLQPRGDAYTRRSTFDCMLAGSIPVFFWKRSIYNQYEWFLGDKPEKFSVFIDRREVRNGTNIRQVLEGYSREEVSRMRENVINSIPKFVYSFMNDSGDHRDAFDLAIDGVLKRFKEPKGLVKSAKVGKLFLRY